MKLGTWELILVKAVIVPALKRIALELEKKAAETPESWDDIMVGTLKTTIEFFENPLILEAKKD